ncbi:hypothetical protein [Phenylobacterium sp.]|jgi:hypothetical protein|uniref:hypothetical protein n=1 Tax=Phenylobacterium sp. TaxID=1871053 RepID=UPI002E30E913|nr:hypothetical protein [Phenylobacterium sp.]HEX3364161.1 hypothetical protein [Phenylobacterium sp.]
MSPEDRTGALLVFTVCVAALMFVLWIEWLSSQNRGLFTPASTSFFAADTAVAAERAPAP